MQKLQIKEEIMAVAALLALGMLAMMPGLIAGSALTKSVKQVPNVGTQISVAYCGYKSGGFSNWDWGRFGECMLDIWAPAGVATALMARGSITTIVRTVTSFLKGGGFWGLGIAVA